MWFTVISVFTSSEMVRFFEGPLRCNALVKYSIMPSSPHVLVSNASIDVSDGLIDWREMQTLTRSMPDFHKTLVLVNVKGDSIEELAMTTEHAPFRHRQKPKEVGGQVKKKKSGQGTTAEDIGSDHKKPKIDEKEESR